MNPLNSIKSRIDSIRNTRKSRYWEYAEYYEDGDVWEDTFLFESFGGANFQGNPYFIYKELIKRADLDNYKIYISAKDPENIRSSLESRGLLPNNAAVIKVHSGEYRKVLSHAKYLVNNVSFTMDFIKKDEQIYLNTWHGTPLKTLGRTVIGDPFAVCNGQRNYLLSDYLIAPNELTKRVYERDYMVHDIMPGELILGGYPRNSVFYDDNARAAVKEKYQLNSYKTIFYMPTWRGTACGVDKVDQVSNIDRLAQELGNGYKVFVKFHPAMGKTSGDFKYCYNMPDDIEVYEFLNAMDTLITDYSSVFFDFAGTGKIIVLYQYDKDEYYKSRGVYREVEESLCFPIAYDYDRLVELVKTDDKTDYNGFVSKFCSYDSIDSAKEALEMLFDSKKHRKECDPVDLYVIDSPMTEDEIMGLKERLDGKNFRFVFVLNRKSKGYSDIYSWEKLDYLSINTYDKLSSIERVQKFLCSTFKTEKAKKKLDYFGARERRRLWGYLNIGSVYTCSNPASLPTALRYIAQKKVF